MAQGSTRVIYAALIGNSLIAITKFVAASITGSSAMFSEGIHSLVDTGNQVLLLHGLKQSHKPADEAFPFGHGKEVYFWSFVVALLIFALGSGLAIYEGIHQIHDPQPVSKPLVNYIVLGLALLFEGGAWYYALREFRRIKGPLGYLEAVRRSKDPSVFVVLFEDSAAMLGLLVAGLGLAISQLTGNPLWDGVAAIIIGLILAVTAIWLAYETKSLLIGESARRHIVADIRRLASEAPGVVHVNEVLTLQMGPEFILVNVSVDFADRLGVGTLEQAIESLTERVKQAHPMIKRVFIEAEAKHPANATDASP